MARTGTKRKRKARENFIANQVDEGKRRTDTEKKILGTVIDKHAPDNSVFKIDRTGKSKEAIAHKVLGQAIEQRRAAKRARRQSPRDRKSEAAIKVSATVDHFMGKKNRKDIAPVEKEILAKRSFDKPEGHLGNRSATVRQMLKNKGKKDDLWDTSAESNMEDVPSAVAEKKGVSVQRRRLVEKVHTQHRNAPRIVHIDSGLSVNPTYHDHQDKLGQALAELVRKDDERKWDEKKMSYDPALLLESREGEIADTGMKGDVDSTSSAGEDEEQMEVIYKNAPDRKTRSQRNKEARKRVMAANIAKKKVDAQQATDFKNIGSITQQAESEADKLSGLEKERRLAENPPLLPAEDAPVLKRIAGEKVRNEMACEPVTLSNELSESMRRVKMPVANPLLRDRFLSFERRGFITPPSVLPKEIRRMARDKLREERKDRRRKKGRGSASDLNFWRHGKKAIR